MLNLSDSRKLCNNNVAEIITHLKSSIVTTVRNKLAIEMTPPIIVMKERALSNLSSITQPSVRVQRSYIEKHLLLLRSLEWYKL